MPRRSSQNNSENSPPTRRVSARIAAIQTASPAAKTPAKASPRKRKSDAIKVTADDSESQQSQVKSEGNSDELNGIESTSTKDHSLSDIQEAPLKKPKVVESVSNVPDIVNEPAEVPVDCNSREHVVEEKLDSITNEFEIIEKDAVPPADSAEVTQAVSVQGEDGNLLVGFVQVHKDEVPTASSIQVKEVVASEPEKQVFTATTEEQITHPTPEENNINMPSEEPTTNSVSEERDTETHIPAAVNGDAAAYENVHPTHQAESVGVSDPVDVSTNKLATVESPIQHVPEAGDVAMDSIVTEPILQ